MSLLTDDCEPVGGLLQVRRPTIMSLLADYLEPTGRLYGTRFPASVGQAFQPIRPLPLLLGIAERAFVPPTAENEGPLTTAATAL